MTHKFFSKIKRDCNGRSSENEARLKQTTATGSFKHFQTTFMSYKSNTNRISMDNYPNKCKKQFIFVIIVSMIILYAI